MEASNQLIHDVEALCKDLKAIAKERARLSFANDVAGLIAKARASCLELERDVVSIDFMLLDMHEKETAVLVSREDPRLCDAVVAQAGKRKRADKEIAPAMPDVPMAR